MTEHWMWPQWTQIGLTVFVIVCAAVQDGEPKTGKHSFAITVVSGAIGLWVLWCGGFFS